MTINRWLPVKHEDVFPSGAYLKGEVEPLPDFKADRRADGSRPQAIDGDTGLPMWRCTVLDLDEAASARNVGVVVKFAAQVQPVPPKRPAHLPWTPVEFFGLTATPYLNRNGTYSSIEWSFRAEGMKEPAQSATSKSGE